MSRIMEVYYGVDRLPYKDNTRQTHYPIVTPTSGGTLIVGENNTTKLIFYVGLIGGMNCQWVAQIKKPNGQGYFQLCSNAHSVGDDYVVELDIASIYANTVGAIYVSLAGYSGEVTIGEEDNDLTISGNPNIVATGEIKINVNIAPNYLPKAEDLNPTALQQVLTALGSKLNITDGIVAVNNIASLSASDYTNGQILFDKNTLSFFKVVNSSFTEVFLTDYFKKGEDLDLDGHDIDDAQFVNAESMFTDSIDVDEINPRTIGATILNTGFNRFSSALPQAYGTGANPNFTPSSNYDLTPKKYVDDEINKIKARTDVVDVVGTKAELLAYDTTKLADNDIIKVLNDESRNDEIAYYRWVITAGVGAWNYVGSEDVYSKTQANNLFATKTELTTGLATKSAVSGTVENDKWKTLTIDGTTHEVGGSGGATYTAGDGIDITNNEISVDTDYVATQTDIANMVETTDIVDNTSSTSTTAPLSANMGKSLQEQINNLEQAQRYLSGWNAQTGLATTNPPVSPYSYRTGDIFGIEVVDFISQYADYDSTQTYNTGAKVKYSSAYYLCNEDGVTGTWDATKWTAHTPKNYKPDGATYTIGVASSVEETNVISVGDRYVYDGSVWRWEKIEQPTNLVTTDTDQTISGNKYVNGNLVKIGTFKSQYLIGGYYEANFGVISSNRAAIYAEGMHLDIGLNANQSLFIKGKSFPSYPVNPTNDKFLAYKTNGTMGWTDGIDLIEITHSALKTLRDNSQLSPGQQYRITDYTCTTTQFDTQSAGHAFDIIVTADSVNVLNENARAIKHSGDTYFTAAGSKLESWELKYCIDNDTSRFAWADTVNGKGVIYYMKDEFNNECPYDFKNIQFKRIVTSVDEEYIAFYEESIFNLYHYWATSEYTPTGLVLGSTSDFIWAYTFHDAVSGTDASLLSSEDYDENEYNSICVHNNIIKENKVVQFVEEETANHPISLNNIVMYYRVYDDEIVSNGTYGNVFEIGCNTMTFSKKCESNTFGDGCNYNTFGNYCYYNTFGNYCNSNTFGNYCESNTFGNYCFSNTFGNYCNSNTFGNYCYSNTFGNDCNSNTFGNDCNSNTLVASGNANYAQYNIFENGVYYVDLKASTSGSNFLQNITVRQGVHGTDGSHKIIIETRGLSHDVTYRAVGAEDKAI